MEEMAEKYCSSIDMSEAYQTIAGSHYKYGYTQALEDVQGKIDGLLKALKYYTLKSNYSIVDEGRNYSVDLKCYELDENTYQDIELGTTALQALEEFHAQADNKNGEVK